MDPPRPEVPQAIKDCHTAGKLSVHHHQHLRHHQHDHHCRHRHHHDYHHHHYRASADF
jgi:hypothetical protein